uniref:EF-hand domain-containing protein n=1 Tax=Plectus sambesii TaxID=2011161 RepID=A0A914UZX0_9BILA
MASGTSDVCVGRKGGGGAPVGKTAGSVLAAAAATACDPAASSTPAPASSGTATTCVGTFHSRPAPPAAPSSGSGAMHRQQTGTSSASLQNDSSMEDFTQVDKDGDEQIDYEEFVQMIAPIVSDGSKDDPFAAEAPPTTHS